MWVDDWHSFKALLREYNKISIIIPISQKINLKDLKEKKLNGHCSFLTFIFILMNIKKNEILCRIFACNTYTFFI